MVNNIQYQPSIRTCEFSPIEGLVNVLLPKGDYNIYLCSWKYAKSVMNSEPPECYLPKHRWTGIIASFSKGRA